MPPRKRNDKRGAGKDNEGKKNAMAAMKVKKETKREAKEGKKKKDPKAPKRPAGGAYGVYLKENRAEIAKTLAPSHSITDFEKEAGKAWRNLSEEEKKPYEHRYQKEMALYRGTMTVYKKTHGADEDEDEDDDDEDEEEEEKEKATPKKKARKGAPTGYKRLYLIPSG